MRERDEKIWRLRDCQHPSPPPLPVVISPGLYKMALDVVEYPEDIAWLDLSFNDIETISEDILEFPALKVSSDWESDA